MILHFLFSAVHSLNLVIDLGSANYKSSSTDGSDPPQPNPVIPAFVAFRANSGFNATSNRSLTEDDCNFLLAEYGEKAIRASEFRPNMTSGFFTALLGLTDSAQKLKAAELFVSVNPSRLNINDAAAVSLFGYIDTVSRGEVVENVGLVFPAYYTVYERLIWTEALKLRMEVVSEFEDVESVAVGYVMAQKIEKPRTVLFVDIGATSVKAYAVGFTGKREVKRLSYACEKGFGGVYVTKSLMGLVRERAEAENTTEAEDRRLFATAEKVKVDLGENEETIAIVEIGGIDRTVHVTRQEFENGGYLDPLIDVVVRVARAASEGVKVDAIELIGGSSKLSLVEAALKRSLGDLVIGRSLDPDSAVALGGAYALQFALNQSSVQPVNVTTAGSLHNVSFVQNQDTIQLCRVGSVCERELKRFGLFNQFSLVYERNNLSTDVAVLTHEYRIGKNGFGNVSLHFSPSPFHFLGYDKCNETCVPARFIPRTVPKLSPALISLLTNRTAKTERVQRLRGSINASVARILDEVAHNGSVRLFSNSTQRVDVIRCAERQKEWARSAEAAKMTDPRLLSARLTEIRRCIAPIYRRLEENRTFWKEAERLYHLIARTKHLSEKWQERAGPGDGAVLFRFDQRLHKMDAWFNETVKTTGQFKELWKGLPVKPKQMADKFTELNTDVKLLKNQFGGARMPRLMRGNGQSPTGREMDELNNMRFMQNLRKMDMDDEFEDDELDL
jgi:hypothetical protein